VLLLATLHNAHVDGDNLSLRFRMWGLVFGAWGSHDRQSQRIEKLMSVLESDISVLKMTGRASGLKN
jgi:hypothetical protein